ncbi:hypothetical protein BMS3Abin06_00682 [bacterium BMS3Abin06]|nr:hypothetical protein BMS3Abin06_00682 [bacterium BMS3Abin06]
MISEYHQTGHKVDKQDIKWLTGISHKLIKPVTYRGIKGAKGAF